MYEHYINTNHVVRGEIMNGLSLMRFLLALVFLVVLFVFQSFLVSDWSFALVIQALMINVLMLTGIFCFGGFDTLTSSSINLAYVTHFLGALLGGALSIVPVLLMFRGQRFGRVPFVLSFLLVILIFPLVSFIVSRVALKKSYTRKFAVLASDDRCKNLLSGVEASTNGRISFLEFFKSAKDVLTKLSDQEREFDAVLVADEDVMTQAEELVNRCEEIGVPIVFLPRFVETVLKKIPQPAAESFRNYYANAIVSGHENRLLRVLDIVLSSAFIIATSPFMIFSWLFIYFKDKGPVLEKEERVGLNGRTFKMMRFRTTKKSVSENGEESVEVTKSGKIISMLRFSELPRLFNVFLGDMSIVGPKPDTKEDTAVKQEGALLYRYRRFVRPGLASYSQIFRPESIYSETEVSVIRHEFDLFYVKNESVIYYLYAILRAFESIFVISRGSRVTEKEISDLSE